MDRHLINKYFSNQCSKEELEQVLDWFQTLRGRTYLEVQIEKDCRRVLGSKKSALSTVAAHEQIFNKIQKNKDGRSTLNRQNETSDL